MRPKPVWLLTCCIAVLSYAVQAENVTVLRKQFVEYYAADPVDPSLVKQVALPRKDGTWPDIEYASQQRGNWPALDHLERLKTLAASYVSPGSTLYQNPDVKDAIFRGLDHWLTNDYRNPNWWYARIGVPQLMAATIILLGGDCPDEVVEKARPILLRSEMGMTGQNKVWCAGNNLMIGMLYDEPERIEQAVAAIWSELRVSEEEGIQPDWSFHQHGPQQQFGNYGKAFAGAMIKWGTILHGTEYALSGDRLEILRNYMLQGVSWIVWNGRMDLSGCGRQIDEGAQVRKGRYTVQQLEAMRTVDPEFKPEYQAVSGRVGFKPFWRSEMAVQRRSDWYASVKMSSTRVIGSESGNSENMQGLHLGDGVMLVYVEGDEYEDIVPLWDWKKLPGTTCDQGLIQLTPKGWSSEFGGSGFSEVLGNGETGMAAMIYKRNDLEAHKAWFFEKDAVVCLGAGISGETAGPVYTSIQQSWLKGRIERGQSWIYHSGIGYRFLDGEPQIETGTVEGNWLGSFPTRGDRPVTGELFRLWLDHGQSPTAATYAYAVFPGVNVDEMRDIAQTDEIRILSNTPRLQAIEHHQGIAAVFYEPGVLKTGAVIVEVDAPCLLSLRNDELTVADPLHAVQQINVSINGKQKTIHLPSGADTGRQNKVMTN